jgi:Zn-dependent hydrolases, including glyoxylases
MTVHRIVTGDVSDSNIFLVTGEKTLLVDTGKGFRIDTTISEIKKVLGGRSLDMIVLTHCHTDHIGGLKPLMDEFNAEAMAGIGDAPYIANADPKYTLSWMFGIELKSVDVTELVEGDVIDLKEHRLRVINTPGHTVGGICLYDEITKSMFSGDTVFAMGVGRTDFESGSHQEMVDSLRKLNELDIGMLYPGHMNCTDNGNRAVEYGLLMMGGLR